MTQIIRDPDLDIDTAIDSANCDFGESVERPAKRTVRQCPGMHHIERVTYRGVQSELLSDSPVSISTTDTVSISTTDTVSISTTDTVSISTTDTVSINTTASGDPARGVIINGMMVTVLEDGLHLINLSGKAIFIHGGILL